MPDTPSTDLPLPDFASTAVFCLIVTYVTITFVLLVVRGLSGVRRVVALVLVALWLSATGAAALSGALAVATLPPPMVIVFGTMLVGSVVFAFSSWGQVVATAVPLWALIAVQAFRLPLELTMHNWAKQGAFPVEMTLAGYNYDILTGIGAILLGTVTFRKGRAARPLAIAYNVMGLALLGVIAVVSIGSLPTPFAYMDPSVPLTLPTRFPFVWLPAACVAFALLCHLLSLRQWVGGVAQTPDGGATA